MCLYSTTFVKYRVPTAQGKWQKKIPQGKHREFGNFDKTQGIWFAQNVNVLTLMVKDISIFDATLFPF